MLIGGLRALILQALHPLAMAAVADHSDYRSDVWGRFSRTSNYVVTTIFGSTRQAVALGARVRAIHAPIAGVDRVTGLPYAADDPVLLLWIHATLVDSFLAAYRRYVGPLARRDANRYVAELVRQAELVGLRPDEVPATEAGNSRFIRSQRQQLILTEPAWAALDTVLNPPLPAWRRPGWWIAGRAALAILPDYALAMYGLERQHLLDAAVRPLVSGGSGFARRWLQPPPVVREARRRAAAAGQKV